MILGKYLGRGYWAAILVFVIAFTSCHQPALAQDDASVAQLLEKGIRHFREAKYDEAFKAFQEAFAKDPTQDQTMNYLESAEVVQLLAMLRSEDPRLSGIARTLLELRRKRVRERNSNVERIQLAVNSVFSTNIDPQNRMIEMIKAANEFGRNLIPFLIPKLGDNEPSVRTVALLWIPKVEIDAIPPLMAASHHPNPLVRQNVARVLGARPVRHPISLGTLAAMMETDQVAEVRDAATESLRAILEDAGDTGKNPAPAKVYHLLTAKKLFLYPHRNPFRGPEYRPTIYTLQGENVVGEVVAPFQLSSRMAENSLLEAIRLDPAFVEAKVALLEDEALQVVEYDKAVADYKGKDPEIEAILGGQKENMFWIRRNRLRGHSPEILFAALQSALEDKRPEVAIKLIEIIQEKGFRREVPPALVDALTDPSSRLVRISAAIALAYWNPVDVQDIGPAVVQILAGAAVNSGIRTVHMVMGNEFNANRFQAVFRDLNVEAGANFSNIAMALQRAVNLPPDFILVDEEVPPVANVNMKAPVNDFINELRKAYRTRNTPVVVAVDPAKIEERRALYQSPERKVLVIPADAEKDTINNQVLVPLFSESEDVKARATKLASRAAGALAYITSTNTNYPVASSLDPLLKVLGNRPDVVRIPSIMTIGNLRGAAAAALLPVTGVFSNKENAVKVREAAMLAIGHILEGVREPAPKEVLDAIRAGLSDANAQLRQASFQAFSVAGTSDEEQLNSLFRQVNVPAAGAVAEAPEAKKSLEGNEKKPAGEEGKLEPIEIEPIEIEPIQIDQ